MICKTTSEAVGCYDFGNPDIAFIRHNENMTYKVTQGDKHYLLRIHKPTEGFDLAFLRMDKGAADLIAGEMKVLQYLSEHGDVTAQKVKRTIDGNAFAVLGDGAPVTALEWVEGETLDRIEMTEAIAREIGVMIGKMHSAFERMPTQNRYWYDEALLSNMIDEASNALSLGHFGDRHTQIMVGTLSCIRDYLSIAKPRFVMVHSDLAKSNLVYHDKNVVPIDFSLCGYCLPEMDLASVFAHMDDDDLNQAILRGYRQIQKSEPDAVGIEICFSLQILLFLITQHRKLAGESWVHDKLDEWCERHFSPIRRTLDV